MEKVNVLLSIYNPNEKYLVKQLQSINNQDYENIEVLINDDCPNHRCDPLIFDKYLTKVKYKLLPYDSKNLNYHKSFEKLLKASDGKYIAFCDQDDIWLTNKLSESIKTLKNEKAILVASDRQIIDENDNIILKSVRDCSNKNYESWKTGDDIAKYNLFVTFAVGMCLVCDGDFARTTIPFSFYTGHDKWIISCAATEGKVAFINTPLVQYRRHGKNVSGTLNGINSKQDYFNRRILPDGKVIDDFFNKYPSHKDRDEITRFQNARSNHKIIDLFKLRNLAPDIARFEIVKSLVPNFMFPTFLKLIRKLNNI